MGSTLTETMDMSIRGGSSLYPRKNLSLWRENNWSVEFGGAKSTMPNKDSEQPGIRIFKIVAGFVRVGKKLYLHGHQVTNLVYWF